MCAVDLEAGNCITAMPRSFDGPLQKMKRSKIQTALWTSHHTHHTVHSQRPSSTHRYGHVRRGYHWHDIVHIPNKLAIHHRPIMIKHNPNTNTYGELGKNIPSFRAVHRHACLFISHQRKRPRHRKRPHHRAQETLDDASRSRRPAAPPYLYRSELACVSDGCEGQYNQEQGSRPPRPEACGPPLAAAKDEVQVDRAGGGAIKVSHSTQIFKKLIHC